MGKLIINNDDEPFTKSACNCTLCLEMNDESYFIPLSNVEKRLLKVIKKIEKKFKTKKTIV